MKFKKGDRVKHKNTNRFETIVGKWKNDFFIRKGTNDPILYASKGEYKVKMDGNDKDSSTPLSGSEMEKI